MSYANGCVTRNERQFNPKTEVKNRKPFKCDHCGKTSPYALHVRNKTFITYRCFMEYFPMELTGDETRLNKIAADLAENRCSGRGKRKEA